MASSRILMLLSEKIAGRVLILMLNRQFKIVCEFATFKTLETQSILLHSHAQPQPILILKKNLNSSWSGDSVSISEAFGGPPFTHNPTRMFPNASKKKMMHF